MHHWTPVRQRRGSPPEHSRVRTVGLAGRGRGRSRRAQVGRRLVGRDVFSRVDAHRLSNARARVHGVRIRRYHVGLEESFWNVKDFGIMILPYDVL